MSAQAVLSMIAPAIPATPQGASGADASAFQGLLATMLVIEDAAVAVSGPRPKGDPAPEALPDDEGDAVIDLAGLPGFLTAPLPITAEPAQPSSETVPPADDASVTGDTPAELVVPPAADILATSPLPVEKTASKDVGPLILPDTGDLTLPDTSLIGEGDEAATIDPALADGQAAGEPKQIPPAPQPAPAATPPIPPLRALAERTSKPSDEPTTSAVSADPVDAKPTAPGDDAAPPPSTQPAKSAAPTTAPAAAPDVAAPASDKAAPAGETVTPAADAAAPVREHALSTLSRATIDATAQIAAQIQRKLESRSTRFEIALRPDELGRVDVKLDIDSEGRLAARLAFDNPVAATDLRGRVDDLRRQLEAAGFQLADDAFEFAERDSGSSAFDRGQDSSRGQNRAFAAAARLNNEIDVAQPPRWLALSLSPSGVDMKV